MAQILRDDQVGSEVFQRLRVDGVKALAARYIFAHEAINLLRRRSVRDARLNHHALAASLFREITLMADPDHFAVEAQRKQNLRSRWQQRNNSHAQNVPHTIARDRNKLGRPQRISALSASLYPEPRRVRYLFSRFSFAWLFVEEIFLS